ncbi:hypothetical protein [Rahnella aceris]
MVFTPDAAMPPLVKEKVVGCQEGGATTGCIVNRSDSVAQPLSAAHNNVPPENVSMRRLPVTGQTYWPDIKWEKGTACGING